MYETGWIILAYIMGSIPFGVILARIFCRLDPQAAGSGNIGATNVTRLCGLPVGLATLLLDAGKGFAAAYLGLRFVSAEPLFLTLTGLAVILGHMHSIFLHFKGGKAVATTIGVFAALALPQILFALLLCGAVIYWKKYVSLGSLVLVGSLPIILLISDQLDLLVLSLAAAALVINAHKDNIIRLIKGEEKPWRRAKTPETPEMTGSTGESTQVAEQAEALEQPEPEQPVEPINEATPDAQSNDHSRI